MTTRELKYADETLQYFYDQYNTKKERPWIDAGLAGLATLAAGAITYMLGEFVVEHIAATESMLDLIVLGSAGILGSAAAGATTALSYIASPLYLDIIPCRNEDNAIHFSEFFIRNPSMLDARKNKVRAVESLDHVLDGGKYFISGLNINKAVRLQGQFDYSLFCDMHGENVLVRYRHLPTITQDLVMIGELKDGIFEAEYIDALSKYPDE